MEPKFDFSHFMNRKLWKQKDAASIIGVSGGLVGMWASNKAVPSYEKIVKLIDNGISAEELFGKELAEKLILNSSAISLSSKIANDPETSAGQQQALKDIESKIERITATLKAKGIDL